jgi:hypothetical protein
MRGRYHSDWDRLRLDILAAVVAKVHPMCEHAARRRLRYMFMHFAFYCLYIFFIFYTFCLIFYTFCYINE